MLRLFSGDLRMLSPSDVLDYSVLSLSLCLVKVAIQSHELRLGGYRSVLLYKKQAQLFLLLVINMFVGCLLLFHGPDQPPFHARFGTI